MSEFGLVRPLRFARINEQAFALMLPAHLGDLFDEGVVVEVREVSAEVFFPVSDKLVRRAGHEAAARAAASALVGLGQIFALESAVASPVDEPGNSSWGLRVVVVLDVAGAPVLDVSVPSVW